MGRVEHAIYAVIEDRSWSDYVAFHGSFPNTLHVRDVAGRFNVTCECRCNPGLHLTLANC
jgi:hypothetical protein